ncbi:MAG: hypothetical protein WCD16_06285, partial [Paracoccaceae bacterium]
MARLFIHAGLHKTGSTSLQHLLEANRDSLPPDVRFVSRHSPAFQRLTAVCRAYDPKARERSAAQVSDAMSSLLDGLAPGPADRLLLSAEDFAGAMPSTRQARPLYDTAPAIAAALLGGAAGHEVSFVYYARARLAWLESWHKHQILWRANPLPWKDLMQRPQVAAFDPVSVVEAVCHAVPAPVISLMLEDDLAVPGPGAGFLRAAGLDAAQI